MQSTEFDSLQYTYIPKLLDEETCLKYIIEFKKIIDGKQAHQDQSCPLSYSIGDSVLFDSLLEQMTPHVEEITGKKLHPTYSYARWYQPGEELKIHLDRPSCEISVTITLGFEGDQWPFYVGKDVTKRRTTKINMNVGDAVVYKGEEVFHWREKYEEGKWQAQVFLHYVDANGPHSGLKYDGRLKLEHHEESFKDSKIKDDVKKTYNDFLVLPNALSSFYINKYNSENEKWEDAPTINGIEKQIRDTKKIQLPTNKGLAAELAGIGLNANNFRWKFNISHCNQAEILKYDKEGKFASHIDTSFRDEGSETRKITVLGILNDEYEGGKLYLQVGPNKIYPQQNKGDVIIFPSFFLHGVEPVTSGVRKSVVAWLVGEPFK